MVGKGFAPDWPAPASVQAWQTIRQGGFSLTPYASFNLGMHVGDDPLRVARNRQSLSAQFFTEPLWLEQVHGIEVIDASVAGCLPRGDAAFARKPNVVCAVMTADCLPVLFCDRAGTVVAAAHAGWKGLLAGVLENTLQAMQVDADEVLAWLGPAIGPQAFEVGPEVREAFCARDPQADFAFARVEGDRFLADIYRLARQRLMSAGVTKIYGQVDCTYSQPDRYFSYRRDGITGRMASLITLR